MSLFAQAVAIGAAADDLLYGETIRFEPQANGEDAELVSAGADPDRQARDLVGIYDEVTAIARPRGSGTNSHETIAVVASVAQVEFGLAQFAATADRPVQGDRLSLVDRPGSPRLQVASARPDAFGRLVCQVVPL